jgi:uncharacterized protein involved in cysteine biosynthesis
MSGVLTAALMALPLIPMIVAPATIAGAGLWLLAQSIRRAVR